MEIQIRYKSCCSIWSPQLLADIFREQLLFSEIWIVLPGWHLSSSNSVLFKSRISISYKNWDFSGTRVQLKVRRRFTSIKMNMLICNPGTFFVDFNKKHCFAQIQASSNPRSLHSEIITGWSSFWTKSAIFSLLYNKEVFHRLNIKHHSRKF